MALGCGDTYWDLDPTNYAGWMQLRDRLAALDRDHSDRELALRLSENLLSDVVDAAGGVEIEIARLRSLRSAAETWARDNRVVAAPTVPQRISNEYTEQAAYSFANLLTWTRSVVERLDRPARGLRNQGLVPALRPNRLRIEVQLLADDLRSGPIGQLRHMTNFSLHAALVRSPYSGMSLDPSGNVRLPIPDTPKAPVAHWLLFEWSEKQDGLLVAEQVWDIIQHFVDGLLAAFERALPEHFRRIPPMGSA